MDVRVTPLGHATCLIEIGTLRVITDPIFDAIPGMLGRFTFPSTRRKRSPVAPHRLGPVDAILLSHAHWDHTDRSSLGRLPSSATVVHHSRNGDLVRRFPDRRGLAWGESTELRGSAGEVAVVTAIPSRHYGSRMLIDKWRGYGGFLVEVAGGPSILFAGDTADTDVYAQLRASRGGRGVDVAIMPIGAYDPWEHNHCTPEQAWRMAIDDLGAEWLVPIHFDVFKMSREPEGEALARLQRAAEGAAASARLVAMEIGVPWALSKWNRDLDDAP